jgi:hypothetical protein
VLGRPFALLVEGPRADGRYEIRIWEGTRRRGARPYLRAPIRGRDVDEARERALEVLHNYVGLDQFRVLAEQLAAELLPGAGVEIRENAREVIVAFGGAAAHTLAVPREAILGPGASAADLRARLRRHLGAQAGGR